MDDQISIDFLHTKITDQPNHPMNSGVQHCRMIDFHTIKADMASKCMIQIKLINGSNKNDLRYKWTIASKKD